MDRNEDRWWYDRGYSLGVVETQRDAVFPRLVGAWILFGLAAVEPVIAAPFLALYTLWSVLDWKKRVAEAEHKRDVHDPGKEWE